MVTTPLVKPVTKPAASTEAFEGSLLLQVTSFFSASDGSTVVVNCCVSPTATLAEEGAMAMEATFFGGGDSLSLQEATRRRPKKANSKFFMVFLVFMLVLV